MNRLELGIVDGRAYFGKSPKVIMFTWGGTWKGIEKLWGVNLWLLIGCLCIHPYLWNLWSRNKNYPLEFCYLWEANKDAIKVATHSPTCYLQMVWLECENAIEIATQTSALLTWNLKRIRETFTLPIYDCQSTVCVSTPIESMIFEWEQSLRVLVSSWSNLMAFSE